MDTELKRRIKEHKNDFICLVQAEKVMNFYINSLKELFPQDTMYTRHAATNYFSLTYYKVDLDNFELNIISEISTRCNCKWKKTVTEDSVDYSTFFDSGHDTITTAYITVYTKPEKSCQIIAIPKGTKKVSKWVQVEEPQFDYIVNCSEKEE